MTRRLIFLLLLALATPSWALTTHKPVAVVSNIILKNTAEVAGDRRIGVIQTAMVTRVLEAFGADYALVPHRLANSNQMRLGYQIFPNGDTLTFDAVICPRRYTVAATSRYASTWRPNSWTRADTIPTIPSLMLYDDSGLDTEKTDRSTDTIGVLTVLEPGMGFSSDGSKGYYRTGSGERWLSPGFGMVQVLNPDRPAGGIRTMIGMYATRHAAFAAGAAEANYFDDSSVTLDGTLPLFGNTDTAAVYMRLNNHVTGGKPMLFMSPCLNSIDRLLTDENPATDFFANAYGTNDVIILAQAIAMLDSLAGGTIIGSASGEPIAIAITLDGGGRRGARTSSQSIFEADSAALKASLDSLAAYRVPITIGVLPDADSLTAQERAWYRRVPLARFAPQREWSAVSTPAMQARADFYALDNLVGRAVSSRGILPFNNAYAATCGVGATVDSFAAAGAAYLRVDVRDTSYVAGRSRGNWRGVNVLGTTGPFAGGSEYLGAADEDISARAVSQFWAGVFARHLYWPYHAIDRVSAGVDGSRVTDCSHCWVPLRAPARVLSVPLQALSGSADGSTVDGQPTGAALRPGLWTLLSVIRSVEAINQYAGRTVIRFVYPEALHP